MARVVNRQTLAVIESAHTPDYPPEEWFINPTTPDCPAKYWKVADGAIVEMTPEEKAAVDAPPPPEPRSEDVVAAYQQFAAAWAATELATPATYEEAIAAMTAWLNEATTIAGLKQRIAIKDAVMLWRTALELRGGSWDDFLAWAAEQQ